LRTLDSAISTALVQSTVRGIYFVRLCFDGGNAAWHSGFGNYSFDSVTYVGTGELTSISPVKEESGVKASGVTVSVSGIKQEIVALLVGQAYINRKAYVHFMPLDEGDQPVTETPVLLFKGSIDSINGNMGASAGFTVTLKSRFADWERPQKILYTNVQQQQLHPGDLGMEFIAQMSQKKLIWPRAAFLPDPRD